jgi:aldehyde:ferredoxin oxidoreductase
MAEMFGATGKILRVNLTTGEITTVEPPEEIYRKYLGGTGLGLYYLFKEGIVEPDVDPLGPDNLFQIMIGPVTGAGANARSITVTKAAYNFNSVATSGGRNASELKMAGWDGIQVTGKADSPVYIEIIDDQVTIKDASHLWGLGAEHTEVEILKTLQAPLEKRESIVIAADMTPEWAAMRPPSKKGTGAKRLGAVWSIGQAGENLVWYACVCTEAARANGRYGPGAIMGSKNLKAIAVRGTKGHKLYDKATFLDLMTQIQASQATSYRWRSYGTSSGGSHNANNQNAYPIRNWQWCAWADPENVGMFNGSWMDIDSYVRWQACPHCVLRCLYTTEATSEDPLVDGTITDMPDWEAMGMVGGMLGFGEVEGRTPDDPFGGDHRDLNEGLAKTQFITYLHDDWGMDYIEGGANLGFVAELYQRGYITADDIDGIELKWGDAHAFHDLLWKITTRDGIGDKLANGTYETAKYFAELLDAPEIMDFCMTGHRYGQPAHDVRSPTETKVAMEYITVARACEHTGGGGGSLKREDWEGGIAGQNSKVATSDSLVRCLFASGNWGGLTIEALKAATGWTDYTEEDMLAVGARIYALSRIFDIHTQQITDPKNEWDNLFPARWFNDPLPTGVTKGAVSYPDGGLELALNEYLPQYWKARGWTEDKGIPTAETLQALGIDDIAEEIAAKYR